MSRDKQIEEMAKQLYGNFGLSMPTARNVATYLTVKKGYRKASEIFEELLDLVSDKYERVTTDCHHNMRYSHVDTPEGMRDLGKAEMLKYLGDKINELKKKYTEEGK